MTRIQKNIILLVPLYLVACSGPSTPLKLSAATVPSTSQVQPEVVPTNFDLKTIPPSQFDVLLDNAGVARFYIPTLLTGSGFNSNNFSEIRLGYGDGVFQSAAIRFSRDDAGGNILSLNHWGDPSGLTVKQGGNVGIGNANMHAPNQLTIQGVTGSQADDGLAVVGTKGTRSVFFQGNDDNAYVFNWAGGTGYCLMGASTGYGWSCTSDARLKKDITTLPDSLAKIGQLRGVQYRMKSDDKNAPFKLGVIAQEVEKVYPELVQTNAEGKKSVNYQALVAPLIEAVKTLKNENTALKEENVMF